MSAITVFSVQGDTIWEQEVATSMYISLHNPTMNVHDIVVEVRDLYGTPVVILTKDEFIELNDGIYKAVVTLPKTTAKGDYDLIATIEDTSTHTRFTRNYAVQVRSKRFMTYLYEVNEVLTFYFDQLLVRLLG